MAGKVLEIQNLIGRNDMASDIAGQFDRYNQLRQAWKTEKLELRNYIFATDTTKTTNNQLPWKNKTTIPKICQIRDNLHANYMSALFPNDDWMKWEAYSQEADDKEKAENVVAYLSNKVRESDYRTTIAQLVYDWIDYGNAFAEVQYVEERTHDPILDEDIDTYIGPRLVRISPLDIVFNPIADSFANSPKITRYIKTIGELRKDIEDRPELNYDPTVVNNIVEIRNTIGAYGINDIEKATGYMVDGFGTLIEYYQSGFVEILEFEGDIYDQEAGVMLENKIITIVDRSHILRNVDNPSWFGKASKIHVGWRLRPDNLYAMGPLDNLVGMQYRIDHLENAKADAMDLTIHPPVKIIGEVEEFVWGPGEEIFIDEGGDVVPMPPNPAAFQVNNEIALLEQRMEEMAGAPKNAMGIRTPGEKTRFEVQTLDNASSRIFQHKITHFEIQGVETSLNMMLEVGRRNLNTSDLVRVIDDDLGVKKFIDITRDDITAKGKIRPIGARHFAAKAQLVQNLVSFYQSGVGQDPTVKAHISGKKVAKLFEDALGLEKFDLVEDNINIMEQMETAKLTNAAQEQVEQESLIETEPELPEELL